MLPEEGPRASTWRARIGALASSPLGSSPFEEISLLSGILQPLFQEVLQHIVLCRLLDIPVKMFTLLRRKKTVIWEAFTAIITATIWRSWVRKPQWLKRQATICHNLSGASIWQKTVWWKVFCCIFKRDRHVTGNHTDAVIEFAHYWLVFFSTTFMCYLLISPCPQPVLYQNLCPKPSLSFLVSVSKITFLFFSSLSSGPLWSPGLFCLRLRLRSFSHYVPLMSPCQKGPEEKAGGGDLWVLSAWDTVQISMVPTSLP